MRFIRKAGAHADKSPKRLHVEPAELARKLVKEMEDHKVSRSDRVYVRNRYTVYLCPEDYENLRPQAAEITAGLISKLAKHVEDMQYRLQGELGVEMVLDPDLELGYFGILAQRVYPQQEAPAAPVPAAAPAEAPAYVPASAPADLKLPAPTEVIAAGEAEQLGLARRVIVVRAGEVVREFSQSRVVLGRGREADFRIDDPNVSRMHAALYWHEGRLMLDDLRSTNGTMVNGYPVTSTVLRPRDVIAIGESRITVEAK